MLRRDLRPLTGLETFVLECLRDYPNRPSYVIKNWLRLSCGIRDVQASAILRALKRLEAKDLVRRENLWKTGGTYIWHVVTGTSHVHAHEGA